MPTKKGNSKQRKNVNAYKKLSFSYDGAQEVEVCTSLPPCVLGEHRGCLKVLFQAVRWEYSIGPPAPKLCLRLKWWGEQSRGTIFRVPVYAVSDERPASYGRFAAFPVRTSIQQLKTYLKDMGSLNIDVGLGHLSDSSMVIGQVTIPALSHLSAGIPVEGEYPVMSPQGIEFGKIMIRFSLEGEKSSPRLQCKAAVSTEPESELGMSPETDLLTKDTVNKMTRLPVNMSHDAENDSKTNKYVAMPPLEFGNAAARQDATGRSVQFSSDAAVVPPDDGGPLPELSGRKARGDVIADLILRGRKLRESMLHAVVQASLVGMDTVQHTPKLADEGELACPESCTLLDSHSTIPGKLLGFPTDDLVALLAGGRFSVDTGHKAASGSSDEDNSIESGDISLTEADHPLHDAELLGTLLYTAHLEDTEGFDIASQPQGGSRTRLSSDPGTGSGTIASRDQAKMEVEKSTDQAEIGDKTFLSKGDVVTADSISSLASFFTSGQQPAESVESVVLRSIGMERLTRLGRVTSVRVTVEKLQLALLAIKGVKSFQKDKKLSRSSSMTYFVEYSFPTTLLANTKSTCPLQSGGELVRIASRQGKDGGVVFSHCSVFPVTFSSQVVQRWWDNSIVLRVYSKSREERMPFLLGKAVLPLKQCLTANQLRNRFVLDVKSPPQSKRQEPVREDHIVGNLEVSFQFITGKQQLSTAAEKAELTFVEPPEQQEKPGDPGGVFKPGDSGGLPTDKPPTVLQLMLFVPEGVGISVPNSSCPSAKPNPYLVCKLFCVDPHPRSAVHWSTSHAMFGFKEVYPVHLTSSLLNKLCNKFVVVEVWNKSLGTMTEDELIGLVKLSVHQFYVAFVDQSSTKLCLSAERPVVAADAYRPIINPFSGAHCGDLAVLMAMGNTSQLLRLQRQLAAGAYVLQPPLHCISGVERQQQPSSERQTGQSGPESQTVPSPSSDQVNAGQQASHTIELCVGGVRQLSAFSNTVWGEADCYVQYHFPVLCDQDPEEDMVCTLEPYCTETSLCIPDPTFDHTTKHTLTLGTEFPLQKVLIKACGSSGGIPFELWRRFYYPNIRDQLIAKASLPLAKLCAMVSMQRSTPNTQSFALPLKLVIDDPEATSGGLLDVFVKYHCSCVPDESPGQQERISVSLSLGVLRCTGLKDSARRAALLPSSPLSFAAEAGVNAYVKVRLPESMAQEERRTKTIALSFAPEFSHFFDICLPLVFQQDTIPHSTRIHKVPLAELLSSGIMCVEVWHEVQKRQLRGTLPNDKCFGRMLVAGSKDILLGSAELPLVQLLYRNSGASGWFVLYCKGDTPLTADRYIGGVELTLSFTREEDRELVISHAARLGWKSDPTAELSMDPCAVQKKLTFEITIDRLWVSVNDVIIPVSEEPLYKGCFVRYRFFSLDPVVSVPRGVASCAEGTAIYQLNHSTRLTIASSTQLYWYLREEPLEVQVWASVVSKNELPRPQASDKLQGCAYIPLLELASQCKDTPIISGSFPLFKSGVDDLNNQRLHITIQRTVVEEQLKDIPMIEIMDTPIEVQLLDPPTTEVKERETALQAVMTHSLMDMFEVHLTVCEALHLQDVASRESCSGPWSVYVTVQPHPTMDTIATPLVQNNGNPVWDYQCASQIPNYYLDSECSGLEFQVWSTRQRAEEWTGEEDVYLGCAHVDLSTLAYGLGQLCGWYHITDFGQQIKGQLKVSISPLQRIRFASSLLMSKATYMYQLHDARSDVGVREVMTEPHNLMPSDSRTTSVLFQDLRRNIAELDKVIQARLEDREPQTLVFHPPEGQTLVSHPPATQVHATEASSISESPDHNTATMVHTGTQYCSPSVSPEHHRESPEHHGVSIEHHRVSPEHHRESPEHQRESPEHHRESPEHHRESPEHHSESTELHRESPEHHRGSPEHHRESPEHHRESPEHHRVTDQDSTSCCSTPVRSQSSSSLTSITRSSHHDTLGEEDNEEVDSAGGEGGLPSRGQAHTGVLEACGDHIDGMKHSCNSAPLPPAAVVEGRHPPVPTAAGSDTSAPCVTSFVDSLPQTGDSTLVPPPTKCMSCKAVSTFNLPDFFMPPHKLEQTMRSLRAAVLSRPPPRPVPTGKDILNEMRTSRTCGATEKLDPHKLDPHKLDSHKLDPHKLDPHKLDPHKLDPRKLDPHKLDPHKRINIGPQTIDDLSPAEMQRIAKVFSSKPKGPPI